MVDNVGSVTDVQVTRSRQPEPQHQPPPPRRQDNGGTGDHTPPNGIAMLGYGSGQALLGMQETDTKRPVDNVVKAADTNGDRKLARDELQKLYQQRMSDANAAEKNSADKTAANRAAAGNRAEQAQADKTAATKTAADQFIKRADTNRDQELSAQELQAARKSARSINIGA